MGIRGTVIAAGLLTGALAAWLATGEIVVSGSAGAKAPDPAAAPAASSRPEAKPFRVRVEPIAAVQRTASLTLRGRTEARARIEVRAETGGMVLARPVQKGAKVAKGDTLCRIEPGARESRRLQVKAALAQAEFDHAAAVRLAKTGYGAEQRVQATQAALDAAKAALAETELDLRRTEIKAPLDGLVQDPIADVGDMLAIGQTCATVVDAEPMLVVAHVSERDVGRLRIGMPAQASPITGETVSGRLRYIAPSAEAQTRTFRLEIEVPNADARLKDGVTTRIEIPLEPTRAHKLSSSALSLADDGRIGIKTVGADNRVEFLPVRLLGDDGDGVWVAGLPDELVAITVGHDFVAEGALVEPVSGDRASAEK